MTSQTNNSQVLKIASAFCFGFARERFKRRLTSYVSTGNTTLCRR